MEPRLEQYLAEHHLTDQTLKVVPLTGDASDRRYFRVLLKDAKPIVLALHAGPIDYAAMPFVAVAKLLSEVPLPVPEILHHSDPLGVLGLEDLGDVTLQAHLGAATPTEHAALYRQAVGLHRANAAARRGAALRRLPAVSHRLRRREADVGARVLRQALPAGLQGRGAVGIRTRRRCARNGRRSSTSWRRSGGCSAIATTTAAT